MDYVISYRDETGSARELKAHDLKDVADLLQRLRSRSLQGWTVWSASDPDLLHRLRSHSLQTLTVRSASESRRVLLRT